MECEHVIEELKKLLKENEAVIAGGSLLTFINEKEINCNDIDIDIYVNSRNSHIFADFFLRNNCYVMKYNIVSKYDNSFMNQNNIISRINFIMRNASYKCNNLIFD